MSKMPVPNHRLALFTILVAQTVLNGDCGLQRIIGGRKVSIVDVPYQLSLRLNGRPICGAALVNQDTALTAAHCLPKPGVYSVRAGSDDISRGGVIVYVKKAVLHPSHDSSHNDYDLAILKLSNQLRFSRNINAVRLPEQDEGLPEGLAGHVSGWGSMSSFLDYYPDQLRTVEVPILNRGACADMYRYFGTVTTRMFCAGYREGGRDSCQGDSGGPFVVNGTLYGLVSWGFNCGEPGYPGVYTNISALRTYIKINANV